MKKIIALYVFLFVSAITVYSQTSEDADSIYTFAEQMPECSGCPHNNIYEFFKENIKHPDAGNKKRLKGKVYVRFVVRKDGSITDIKILKSLSPECDQEVVRIAEQMPQWRRGAKGGKPVNVSMVLSWEFK
jgi:TonB family protein